MHPEKVDWAWRPELSEMVVRLVRSDEQRRYQQLMRAHHYLGYLPKIGETLWYVATWREQWLALLSFSGSALKCAVRDRWIGRSEEHTSELQSRLHLVCRLLLEKKKHVQSVAGGGSASGPGTASIRRPSAGTLLHASCWRHPAHRGLLAPAALPRRAGIRVHHR